MTGRETAFNPRAANCLFLLIVWAGLTRARAEGGPDAQITEGLRAQVTLTCDKPAFDFGDVDPMLTPESSCRFTIMNRGETPCKIARVRSSCGCAVAMPPGDVIPANGKADITATIRWGDVPMRRTASLFVTADGNPDAVLQLVVAGTVSPAVRATPQAVFFPSLAPGESTSRYVTLWVSRAFPDFQVSGAECTSPTVGVRGPPATTGQTDAVAVCAGRWELTAVGRRQGGVESCALVLRTNLAHMPEVRVPVTVCHAGWMEAEPPALVFEGKEGSVNHVAIRLAGRGAEPSLSLESCQGMPCPIEIVKVTTSMAGGRQATEVKLRVSGREFTSDRSGWIRASSEGVSLDIPFVIVPPSAMRGQ